MLHAIGRNSRLAAGPEIIDSIRKLAARPEAAPSLLPVLHWPALGDTEVLTILTQAWGKLAGPQRLEAIQVLFGRPAMLDRADPAESALEVLRRAVSDPSPAVRDRTLRRDQQSAGALVGASRDGSFALGPRRRYARPASAGPLARRPKTRPVGAPDAQEHLKRLLVDPDAQVRTLALSVVEQNRLIAGALKDTPAGLALARRVKALEGDPALSARAMAVLTAQGAQPGTLTADVHLGRSRLLSFSTFRRQVNPVFYRLAEDKNACASCHGNHTILRVAEADPSKGFTNEQLMINYSSALKVVNLGEPEASLILRKPRSPHGAGGPDPSSATGLSHVGGQRWENTEDPAYRAILDWIREAALSASEQTAHEALSADSYAPGYEPSQAGDGDLATIWHTEFVGTTPGYPHELVIDLGSPQSAVGLLYVPRQDGSNGRVKDFEIRISQDAKTWSSPLVRGRWENDVSFKYVALPGTIARYVQLRGLSEVEGRPFMSAAEVSIETKPTSGPGPKPDSVSDRQTAP